MTKPKHNPDWDYEPTDEELARMRPAMEVAPEVVASMIAARKTGAVPVSRGRPKTANPKKLISIYLSASVIAKFKATGAGWQTRINEVLERAKL